MSVKPRRSQITTVDRGGSRVHAEAHGWFKGTGAKFTNSGKTVMNLWKQVLQRVGIAALALALSACSSSDDDQSPQPPTPPAAVAPGVSAPAAVSVVAGQPAVFTVVATGTSPLAYQWQRNGADIPGASAATLTLPAVTAADDGAQFRVRVTNAAGNVLSSPALLTVQPLLVASIVAQPVGATITAGAATTFSVQAAGTAPLSYQWQRDGQDIPGATAASYALPASSLADTGAVFRVRVSNAAGSVTSTEALLTVVSGGIAAPTIATQPESATLLDGDLAVLNVAASGSGPFSYQWRRNGTPIPGATTAIFFSNFLTLADSGAQYSVVVSNGGGSVTSNNATITVTGRPIDIVVQPVAKTQAPGETAFFLVLATGTDPKSYQWLRNGVAVPGATMSTYTTPPVTTADNGALYSVRVTNPVGSVTSTAALLTVPGAPVAPSIATQPAGVTVTEGLPATFSVTASGTGSLAYQWRRNGTAISGATSASYTLNNTVAADNAARFSVIVSSSAGSVTSTDALLTVQAATGPMIGRAWATAQSLEENTSAVSVLDRRAAIDDAGNVTVLFRKNNGSRDALYATRGTPGGPGLAPTWTAPVLIDVLAGAPVSAMGGSPDYSLTAAPGGDMVALWYHNAACTAATYRTSGTCRYYHYARYRAATGSWEAPVLLTDASNPGFEVFTNDRGDLVFFGNSWVRSGTTSSTPALALFMRAAAETTTRRQLLNAEPINAFQLGLDAAGNLLLAAQYQQNATTDLVAYRGTVAAGLGPVQVLDTRGSAATLRHLAVGLNGQQVITWTQNNGVKNTTFAASSATAAAAFTVVDLDRVFTSNVDWQRLLVTDAGEAIYYDLWPRLRARWSASTGWTGFESMPAGLPFSAVGGSDLYVANRNGDLLAWRPDAFVLRDGRTTTYEARRNVVVNPTPVGDTGPGFVLGLRVRAGYGQMLLSTSGIGFTDLLNQFDVLPTVAAPAGDGRAVTNLWGAFLK